MARVITKAFDDWAMSVMDMLDQAHPEVNEHILELNTTRLMSILLNGWVTGSTKDEMVETLWTGYQALLARSTN